LRVNRSATNLTSLRFLSIPAIWVYRVPQSRVTAASRGIARDNVKIMLEMFRMFAKSLIEVL